jgi:(2Fe-2S) ferredoxin
MSDNTVIQCSHKIPKPTKFLDNKALRNCLETLGIAKVQRHISLCPDQTVTNCCSKQASLESGEYLKRRLPKLKLYQSQNSSPVCIFKTKANSLRVFGSRPIMVVYADGVWYCQANLEVIGRIAQKHLIGIMVVEEYAFLTHPLPETSLVACEYLIAA